MEEELEAVKATVDWLDLEVIGEPFVELTMRGYAPLLPVRNMETDDECKIYISASSFGKKLEPLRKENNGTFEGLKFRVKKESAERTASYVVEPIA